MHKVYTDAYPTRADKRKVWRSLVLEWRSSSLTVRQFSEKNQLKEADLQRWGYRLKNQVRTNNEKNIFHFPKIPGDVFCVNATELGMLLEGIDLTHQRRMETVEYDVVN